MAGWRVESRRPGFNPGSTNREPHGDLVQIRCLQRPAPFDTVEAAHCPSLMPSAVHAQCQAHGRCSGRGGPHSAMPRVDHYQWQSQRLTINYQEVRLSCQAE